MRLITDDNLVAATGMREKRREVALRSARGQQRGILAESFGSYRLKAINGWVFSEDVVTQLRLGHRPAHIG
jgi:hypothetical protein